MKIPVIKYGITFFIFALAFVVYGQENLSLHTQLLLQQHSSQTEVKSYTGNVPEVSCFISVNNDFNPALLEPLNVTIVSELSNLLTIRTPIEQIQHLASLPGVEHVSLGVKAQPKLNIAVPAIRADSVHNGINLSKQYTGEGIIVGVVDIGFDFTHPTFTDNNGNLRISRCWIQTENGNGPSGFSYGKEYIGEAVLLQKRNSNPNETHGTHVCGIAAGKGSNIYKGIAYDAEIVLVETGATDTEIVDAVNYIFRYAASVNKPAVVNLSFGGHWGPHDGSSYSDNAFDKLTGPGKIIVGSAGNEGDKNLHIQHTFSSNTDTLRTLIGVNTANHETEADVNVWSDFKTSMDVAIEIYDLATRRVVQSTAFGPTSSYYKINENFRLSGGTINIALQAYSRYEENQKPYIQLNIKNPVSNRYGVALLLKGKAGQQVNLWNNGNANGVGVFTALQGTVTTGWLSGNSSVSVAEIGGTGKSTVSVGSYNTRNQWRDINNQGWSIPETVNDISTFSSKGPTVDGRVKPEITAPGSMICSSVNYFDTDFLRDEVFLLYKDNTGHHYGLMEGTSMSAPIVTGVVALMLQRNPDLTPADIKEALKQLSIQDVITGNIGTEGNNIWGYGKINSYALMASSLISPEPLLKKIRLYYSPESNTLYIQSDSDKLKIDRIEIFNVVKQKIMVAENVTENAITLPYPSARGVLFVRIYGNNQSVTHKILR